MRPLGPTRPPDPEWACPSCGGALGFSDDVCRCQTCGRSWPIVDGVPYFVSEAPYWGEVSESQLQSILDETRIESEMVPLSDVVLLDEHAPLGEAIGALAASDLQRGLVIEDDRLVGLVSVSDIARAFERRARML